MTFLAVVWFLQLSLRLLSHFKAFLESLYYESYCQLILQPEVEQQARIWMTNQNIKVQSSIYPTKLVTNPQKFLSCSSFRDVPQVGLALVQRKINLKINVVTSNSGESWVAELQKIVCALFLSMHHDPFQPYRQKSLSTIKGKFGTNCIRDERRAGTFHCSLISLCQRETNTFQRHIIIYRWEEGWVPKLLGREYHIVFKGTEGRSVASNRF